GHFDAHLSEGRRHLAADEAEAHQHPAPRLLSGGTDQVRVLHGAELQDTGEPGAGRRERAIAAACRHEQLVVREPLAAPERHLLARGIDGGGPRLQAQVDARARVVVRGLHELILELLLAAQIALGQRRPVVRRPRLFAHQGDVALEAAVPQSGGGGGPGQGRADDDDALSRHSSPPSPLDGTPREKGRSAKARDDVEHAEDLRALAHHLPIARLAPAEEAVTIHDERGAVRHVPIGVVHTVGGDDGAVHVAQQRERKAPRLHVGLMAEGRVPADGHHHRTAPGEFVRGLTQAGELRRSDVAPVVALERDNHLLAAMLLHRDGAAGGGRQRESGRGLTPAERGHVGTDHRTGEGSASTAYDVLASMKTRSKETTCPIAASNSASSSRRSIESARIPRSPWTATWSSSSGWTTSATTRCGWASITPRGGGPSRPPRSPPPPPRSAHATSCSVRA